MKSQKKQDSSFFETQLIRAGAGTGKTTRLIQEIYSQFQKQRKTGQEASRLIVCTFTRKASQELKQRLYEKAQEEIKTEGLSLSPLFLNYIQSPSLYISTIDGILSLFLKKQAHQMNVPPDFQIHYAQSNEKLFDSLAEDFIFKKNLPLLQKIPYPFLKQLFLSYFTMRMEQGKISFYNEDDFNDFENFWRQKDFIKQNWDSKKEISKIFNNEQYDNKTHSLSFIKMLETLQNMGELGKALKTKKEDEVSFKANHFLPIFKQFHPVAEEFCSQFIERKKSSAILDIEDLLLFSLDLLRKNPQAGQSFSKEWDGWLIDEYQDTSWLQEQIIKHITKFKNVFCVGDPAQSIYFFRGADPYVFKRREISTLRTEKLNENYRSIPDLIHFYNDFFEENQGVMKFKAPAISSTAKDDPCVYFLTYEKHGNYKPTALKALYYYVQKLVAQGATYSDIAILSSKNDDLITIAKGLRSWNIPLILDSSKNFAQERLILDALFLLKFLINPFDDNNLKALLRTDYFHLPDQELADASCDHTELCKSQKISFWTFLKNRFPDKFFVQSLNSYLDMKKSFGLVQSFEKALMDSGLMDLSYFQDPTGVNEVNLSQLISLLHKKGSMALELFYSLTKLGDEEESKTTPPCEGSQSIQLMTIHKSKGLEFKNVIVMDFSLDRSSLRVGNQEKDNVIYDKYREKAVFSVPVGGRDRSKVKSFGHKIALWNKKKEELFERDRLFYVAMTRAKNSLAFFVPNNFPEKNSWLADIAFFEKFSKGKPPLLEKISNPKKELRLWRLNKGIYKAKAYSFCVQPSELWAGLSDEVSKKAFPLASIEKIDKNLEPAQTLKEPMDQETPAFINEEKLVNSQTKIHFKSSKDFVSFVMDREVLDKKKTKLIINNTKTQEQNLKSTTDNSSSKEGLLAPFSLVKTRNILFKTCLGNHLHLFLQKLSYQGFDKTEALIERAFLKEEDKKQLKSALFYTFHLKNPLMKKFLKTGFPEWPFKIQKNNIVLQGVIDLWAWDSQEICLFDYKSSPTDKTKWQLIFYSYVLNELYHPKKIRMVELYPFQKKVCSSIYDESQKEKMEIWLKSFSHSDPV